MKSSRNYKCLKLWCSGSWPHDRRSGANALVTSAGEAGFLAFEAIVWSAGFHLKFLAFKSCEVWSQPPKSLKPPRNGIRRYRLAFFDWVWGLWLSVLSQRITSKTSKWRQVKATNRTSVWINLLYIPMNQWLKEQGKPARVKNAVRMRVFPASGAYLPLKLYAITKQTRFRPQNSKK